MRVLFAAKYLDSGGITTHMYTLASELRKRGVDVGIVSGGKHGTHTHGPEWFERSGIPHFTVPFSGREKDLSKAFWSLLKFPRVVRNFAPDLIHVHWRSVSVFAEIVRVLCGIPYVSTLHLDRIPKNGLEGRLSFWGSYAIAISQETKKYLVEGFRVPEAKVVLIPHGVDAEEFSPPTEEERVNSRSALHLSATDFVIAYVGRLATEKRIYDLVNAVGHLLGRYRNIHLLVAGTGPLEGDLRETSSTFCGHLHLLGYTKTRTVLSASDVLCLPSGIEGFPIVVVEAMMMGLPVIRTTVAGAADQITHGVSGLLYEVGDIDALVSLLQNLLEDQPMRARIGSEAHRVAKSQFSADVMAERTLMVYEKVLAQGG